jgi:hypothetical protein
MGVLLYKTVFVGGESFFHDNYTTASGGMQYDFVEIWEFWGEKGIKQWGGARGRRT